MAEGSKQVLDDLPPALSGRGLGIIFIIITEVIMVNWRNLIGLHYTDTYFLFQDICSRGEEMMVIFSTISRVVMLNGETVMG